MLQYNDYLTLDVFGSLVAVYFTGFTKILNLFGAAIFSRAVHSTSIQIVQYKILAVHLLAGIIVSGQLS